MSLTTFGHPKILIRTCNGNLVSVAAAMCGCVQLLMFWICSCHCYIITTATHITPWLIPWCCDNLVFLNLCLTLRIQWNPSLRTPLKSGHLSNKDTFSSPKNSSCVQFNPWHLTNMDTFICPIGGVWIRGAPPFLQNNSTVNSCMSRKAESNSTPGQPGSMYAEPYMCTYIQCSWNMVCRNIDFTHCLWLIVTKQSLTDLCPHSMSSWPRFHSCLHQSDWGRHGDSGGQDGGERGMADDVQEPKANVFLLETCSW